MTPLTPTPLTPALRSIQVALKLTGNYRAGLVRYVKLMGPVEVVRESKVYRGWTQFSRIQPYIVKVKKGEVVAGIQRKVARSFTNEYSWTARHRMDNDLLLSGRIQFQALGRLTDAECQILLNTLLRIE